MTGLESAGSSAATRFDEVFCELRPPMVRLAYVSVGSHTIAEEIVQEGFIRLHRHFETVENPGGFLRVTVVRLCATWHRRHAIERDRVARIAPERPAEFAEIDETWNALDALSPERRVVLALRYYEDLTYEEIASLLGVPVTTVRTRAWRGLRDLRKELTR